ncbi:hypothetical protein BS47DRAFT_1389487 [Hydnum rufescens UP504]|uniref:Plus3 domain-containing protein n=1 Tax=Hydnum rufescens UP504 TaxID=1448309 RepID=A0A9P6B501_9AGAM|nr:hypothetical protein BS47DRAFT_1389487 [Hydnum rufescens UP504]
MPSDDDHSDIGTSYLLSLAIPTPTNPARSGLLLLLFPNQAHPNVESKNSDDEEPESEEDESNPYPLDGKYKDELDRQNLMTLPETERERIISERLEQRQRLQDKLNLERLVKAQRKRPDSPEEETVAKPAKRGQTPRDRKDSGEGPGLAALTEKRRAKKERDAAKEEHDGESPKPNRQESSDESSEDGEINKVEEEYDEAKNKQAAEAVTLEDISKARITRDMLAKYCHAPWFEELAKGGWVRYNFGPDSNGNPCYRLCEVIDVGANLVPPYNIDEKSRTNRQLELKHGTLQRCWNMDRVSNAHSQRCDPQQSIGSVGDVKLPKKAALEKKRQQINKFATQRLTEADLQTMITGKKEMEENRPSFQTLLAKKARLNQQRTLAQNRRDLAEVGQLTEELAKLEKAHPELLAHRTQEADRTAIVNERNRRANLEAVRLQEKPRKSVGGRRCWGIARRALSVTPSESRSERPGEDAPQDPTRS